MENEQGPQSQDEIPPGTIIGERYKVVKQLGQGGMGVVFQVEHAVTHRRLAIKAMRRTRDDSFRQRFLTEARAACAVQHPAIVPIHDVIESDGRVLMIMDFLEGHDLYDLVQQRPGQRIHIQEVAAHLLPIVSALGALHTANLVHRDIKPENIFISHGKSFLLDLGVAKDLQSSVRLTQTTTGPIGTPLYMSPEQAFGTLGPVDARSDIWALGIVLYECLTGSAPTMAEGHGEMYGKIGAGNFPLANLVEPSVPSEVADLVNDMLQVSRHNRPAITRVYDVLAKYASSHLIASYPRPVGPVEPVLELTTSTPAAPPPTPEQIAAVAAAAAAKASLTPARDPHRETGGPTTTSPGAALPPKKASVLGWFGLAASAVLVSALGVGGYFAWRLMNVKVPPPAAASQATTESKTAEPTAKPSVDIASATAVASTPTAVETTSAEPSTSVASTRTGKLPTAPPSAATTAATTATTTPAVATTQTATTVTSSPSAKSTGLQMPFDPNKKN